LKFAFEKALDQRGISASLMYDVISMWNWILEEGLENFEEYPQYGLPLFKATALKYGFENPIGEDNGYEYKYAQQGDEESKAIHIKHNKDKITWLESILDHYFGHEQEDKKLKLQINSLQNEIKELTYGSLEDRYKKDTSKEPKTEDDIYSSDYVLWLEHFIKNLESKMEY